MTATPRAVGLRTEHATDPIAVAVTDPELSWQVRDGEVQQWQVRVATQPELLPGAPDLWDSGQQPVQAARTTYAGRRLGSRSQAWWTVRLWGADGSPGPWSETARFEIALLQDADWTATWLGVPCAPSAALFLRRSFDLASGVRRARLHGVGLGWGEFYVNGARVGDHVLDPAQTNTAHRVLYSTYDVTDMLSVGENVLGAVVGPGWAGRQILLAQLEIDLENGTSLRVETGRTRADDMAWSVASGPIVEAGVYDGERYDARLEHPPWCTPGEGSRTWGPMRDLGHVMNVDRPGGVLVPQTLEPIRVVRTFAPVSLERVGAGSWVLDTGRNLAGWCRLRVRTAAGRRVRIRFGEVRGESGEVNQENLRHALARDEYVARGDGEEVWEPRFTYHGFRYAQIDGDLELHEGDVEVREVRSDVAQTAEVEAADPFLARLHDAVVATEGSNLHGIPTDCPQRSERMGWLNDLTVRSAEMVCTFDTARLLAKWLDDVADTQGPDGSLTDTAPFRAGLRPADPVAIGLIRIPRLLRQHFGDQRTTARHADAGLRWVDFLQTQTTDHIVGYSSYGDWAPPVAFGLRSITGEGVEPETTPGELVSTAHYAMVVRDLAETMRELGRPEAGPLATRWAEIRDAFNRVFVTGEGRYGNGNQACQAIALHAGLVPEESIAAAVTTLTDRVYADGVTITTGNLATSYVLDVLADHGHIDLAYRLVTQPEYPGWRHMLDQGATTIWERWELETGFGMNSHNHPMYASVGGWLHRVLAGVQPRHDAIGFSSLTIDPRYPRDLPWFRTRRQTVRGEIRSQWRREGEEIELTVVLPHGVDAQARRPGGELVPLEPGSTTVLRSD